MIRHLLFKFKTDKGVIESYLCVEGRYKAKQNRTTNNISMVTCVHCNWRIKEYAHAREEVKRLQEKFDFGMGMPQ